MNEGAPTDGAVDAPWDVTVQVKQRIHPRVPFPVYGECVNVKAVRRGQNHDETQRENACMQV